MQLAIKQKEQEIEEARQMALAGYPIEQIATLMHHPYKTIQNYFPKICLHKGRAFCTQKSSLKYRLFLSIKVLFEIKHMLIKTSTFMDTFLYKEGLHEQ